MKKIFYLLAVCSCVLFLYSCDKNTASISNVMINTTESTETTEANSSVISDFNLHITRKDLIDSDTDTTTENTTEILSTTITEKTTEEKTSSSVTSEPQKTNQSSDSDVENNIYQEYISEEFVEYLKNKEIETASDPVLLYFDLDDDSVNELVVFQMHKENISASVHFYDIENGMVRHIHGSDYVAPYRTAIRFTVFIDTDGKYYIRKSYNDGGYMHMITIYSYNGYELVPVRSIYGCFNEPEFYYISDNGSDAFEESDEGFREISKEEFLTVEEELYNRGKVVFSSSDSFQ